MSAVNTASGSLMGPPKICAKSTIIPSIDLKVYGLGLGKGFDSTDILFAEAQLLVKHDKH